MRGKALVLYDRDDIHDVEVSISTWVSHVMPLNIRGQVANPSNDR